MAFLGGILGELVSPITNIIDKAVVDKDKKKELEYKIQELVDKTDQRFHEELMGQLEVNKVEAAHPSIFVAGWRPFIGWVGGFGLGYSFVLAPFVEFIAKANGFTGEMPVPDSTQLLVLVTSMLGVGAMRSYDKREGTDTKKIK